MCAKKERYKWSDEKGSEFTQDITSQDGRSMAGAFITTLEDVGSIQEITVTVISTLISRICSAHASDSFITELQTDRTYRVLESQRSKIVIVRHWRGAMAYWGLATCGTWVTLDWLQHQANEAPAFRSAEEFARAVAIRLQQALSTMQFNRSTDAGIGIHFTTYEYVGNYWIPELFLISNWADPSYTSLRPEGIGMSRETYHIIANEAPRGEHQETRARLRVKGFLDEGGVLIFNNGDPVLFNAAANGLGAVFRELARRGRINAPSEITTYLAMARRPVEIVASVQRDFCQAGTRLVGGRIHDVAVTPGGEYLSTTGDAA